MEGMDIMINIDKISILDSCIDGNIAKLFSLISQKNEHFNTAYTLCKESVSESNVPIHNIQFEENEASAMFSIECEDKNGGFGAVIALNNKKNAILTKKTKDGYLLTITTPN